jgi:hypothetical protein
MDEFTTQNGIQGLTNDLARGWQRRHGPRAMNGQTQKKDGSTREYGLKILIYGDAQTLHTGERHTR